MNWDKLVIKETQRFAKFALTLYSKVKKKFSFFVFIVFTGNVSKVGFKTSTLAQFVKTMSSSIMIKLRETEWHQICMMLKNFHYEL